MRKLRRDYVNHPAFPVVGDEFNKPNTGMSMRDFYMASILTGLCSNVFSSTVEREDIDGLVAVAEQIADAVMLERKL
jgi:hypothetical protein